MKDDTQTSPALLFSRAFSRSVNWARLKCWSNRRSPGASCLTGKWLANIALTRNEAACYLYLQSISSRFAYEQICSPPQCRQRGYTLFVSNGRIPSAPGVCLYISGVFLTEAGGVAIDFCSFWKAWSLFLHRRYKSNICSVTRRAVRPRRSEP